MLKIALVCQHGASTGICVEKMKQAAAKDNNVQLQLIRIRKWVP